ncbi:MULTISPECIES: AAA family ATPase [unclassified Dietzia]|uniref:AAA family ATPase n=1 Tax=unclassified Dietzia TaxID=2617939 RepID=UPI0015FC8BF0|nr:MULTISPECIES: AAA family ATPase [unclassified Dietzia]MBB1024488.1 AAA family ATPase [Dietzia sp. DQ12-76]MBB1028572.1 AAA family ATPase [Dietzia sp. DQ11-38-2]
MSRLAVLTESADLRDRVRSVVGDHLVDLPLGPLPSDPARMLAMTQGAQPLSVIVLDAGPRDQTTALEVAAGLRADDTGISVVLVSDRPEEIGFAAMRAGVCDIVHPDADPGELGWVLERARRTAVTRQAGTGVGPGGGVNGSETQPGRVISVASPKGGVGKTTVATNLAVGLARSDPHSTVLVDLDVQFGDVGSALNLAPEYTLVDVVHGPAAQDTMVLKTFLTQHETGLYVVCGPGSPAEADSVGMEDISRLLQTLASEFRYVVVDTAPGLTEPTLTVLDNTHDLVLVTSMDVPGVRGLRKEIDILRELGMVFSGRHVVLNFADTQNGLTKTDVEATIGASVDMMIPRSKGAVASVNQGIPLLQSDKRDPVTTHLRKLVGRFTSSPARAPRSASAVGKFLGRLKPTPTTATAGTPASPEAPGQQVSQPTRSEGRHRLHKGEVRGEKR